MDKTEFSNLLTEGAAKLGVTLDAAQVDRFYTYMELLLDWNTRINLTAITEPADIITKHFLDSLSLLKAINIPEGANVVDVGTGAGFPGIPLKLARPDLRLTLIDSLNKRIKFLGECVSELEMDHVDLHHLRAEEGGRSPVLRDSFDFCVSRAVADLSVLAEYCLPYVKPGGYFAAMKGTDCKAEVNGAKPAIRTLSGVIENIKTVNIPLSDISHSVIIVKKLRNTAAKYPRHSSQIAKAPLK